MPPVAPDFPKSNALIKLLLSGSFHTASKYFLNVWSEVAKAAFKHVHDEDYVKKSGVYNKVIIDCAFRENLRGKKEPDTNGGCKDFEPSLTTNGMCYTFNGKHSSELWKSSEMTTAFADVFPSHRVTNKTFGGHRTVQGNKRD